LNDNDVKKYFHEIAHEFDGIYDNQGGIKNKFINKFLRKSLYERVPVSINECGILEKKKVLDIGCGSGRVSFLLAEKGANVTGIDYAKNMIKMAQMYREKSKFKSNVEFFQSDFMTDFDNISKFDISIALGVFDYIENPVSFMQKIKNITTEKFIASFPAKYNLQSTMRKLWLRSRNCPVYFYDENKIMKLFADAGMDTIHIIKLPKNSMFTIDYVVVAQL